ncbi:MAG TPA: carboxypeptidase regulatory-like domain-containing protein, partial [Blastocatellia bacterium]|nr:carboxypeptidase regulatory-like domain-containing protein [Blastocatellia bacterium]
MKKITVPKVWMASAIIIALAGAAFGQNDGSITGQVKDGNGAAIAGATVRIVNPVNNVSRTANTDADGFFVAPQLPPGAYTISVEKSGFKKVEKSNVVLSTSDKLNAGDFTLEVGQVTEAVQIQADLGQLQIKTESGERSDLVTNRQIRGLALNGRNILDLTKTIPGIINTSQAANSTVTNAAGTFTINGVRSNMHEVTVDGSTNLNTGNNSGLLVTLNPDAVAEIKILTSNYQAEYGRAGGGFVQLTTRSGTNEYHGGGRYFRRHDSLNANNYFNNARNQPRPIYRYNFYGYDFSGPVPFIGEKGRRKLFFFFSQEYYRQVVPEAVRNIRVPTEAERSGDFSQTTDGNGNKIFIKDPLLTGACNATDQTACFRDAQGRLNVIPQNRFFNNGQAILNLYPKPNVSGNSIFNFTSQVSSKYPRREDILRMDYQISEGIRLSGRFIRNEDEQQFAYGTTSASWNWPLSFAARRNGPGYTFGFTLTNTFSPTLVNEFSYAPSRGAVTIAVVDDKFTRAANNITVPLLFPDANNGGAIPNFNYGGIANQTFPTTGFNGSPFTQTFSLDNFTDNLTKVWGKHTIKTGLYWQISHNKRTSFGPIQANINFNNDSNNPLNTGHPFANALLGVYNTYEQASVQLTNDFVYNNVEGYVQDTWKITPRLTFDYGVRLSYYQPLYDLERQLSLFNPALYDRSKAVRIYAPVCVNNAATCPSGTNRRAVDPALLVPGFTPTLANTLPLAFLGLIVPNSGDITNGIGLPSNGAPRGGYESDSVLWGPRFGFAYDLTGDQKTVIRGGFGINYDRIRGDVTIDGITNPPNVLQPTLFYGTLDNIPSLRNSSGVRAIPNVIGVYQGGELPTVYTYSLGVQRNLGWSTAVDVAYV